MRLVLLLAWRHLVFRPGKTLASVLGIAVGIATVVAVLVVDHNTLASQEARRAPSDPDVDLLVQPDLRAEGGWRAAAAELAATEGITGVAAFAKGKRHLALEGVRRRVSVEVVAVERAARDHHGAYVVEEGDDLDWSGTEPTLLVSSGVAEVLGLGPGDRVMLVEPEMRRVPLRECVDGELVVTEPAARRTATPPGTPHPFRVAGVLAPTRLGYAKMRVVTTLASGDELFGRRLNPQFWADLDPAVTDLVQVTRTLGDRFVVTAPKRALAGLAPEERAFRSGVRFCGFLALFLGLYIIFNTMSMSLVERVRSIGLLRALGLTRGRLLLVFVAEGAALALLGAGLSLVLAERVVAFMEARGITTLGWGKPLEVREVPWGPVAAVLVAGIVFCLAGVLYPFLRASRLSVIDALRRGVIELAADPFTGVRRSVLVGLLAVVPVAWIVGAPSTEYVPEPLWRALVTGFGLVGTMFAVLLVVPGVLRGLTDLLTRLGRGPAVVLARTTLAAARHRVFGTVSGLMLVFTAIVLIMSVLEGLKAETRGFGARALDGRLFIKTTPAAADAMRALREAEPEFETLVPLNAEVTSGFVVRGIHRRLLSRGPLAGDREALRAFVDEPTIILSTRCADDLDKVAGDTVRLATAADGLVDFRVLAVTDAYGFAPDDRVFGVVSARTLKNLWCVDSEGLGDDFVAWAPGTSPERAGELAARAAAILGDDHLLDFRRGEDITAEYVADLDRNFAIFYAILALTVLLATVGVLNAMVIAVMERHREIGLLRAVGLTGGQVATMLMIESGVLGVLGGVFGLLLGLPLAALTIDALRAVSHLELTFALSPRALGAVLAGAVLVSVLAVILPALRANRMSLSRVMRYE